MKFLVLAAGLLAALVSTPLGLDAQTRLSTEQAAQLILEKPEAAYPPLAKQMSLQETVLIHSAGRVSDSNPLGYTGLLPGNHGVSEACQLVCSPQYPAFLKATGVKPGDGSPPQRHFTVTLNTSANQ